MATTKWTLDPTHSELQFKVKHLMITTVTWARTSGGACGLIRSNAQNLTNL